MGGRSRNWPNGSTRRWRKTRQMVLDRDNHTCRLRLDGCTTTATHVHHTVDRVTAGDSIDHLLAACAHCNLKLGDPTKHDATPHRRRRW